MPQVTRIEIILKSLGIEVVKVRGRRAWALCKFHDDSDATNFFVRTTGDHAGTYHCLGAETLVLTRDGFVSIRELAGSIAKILTVDSAGISRWVDAPFYSFGKQRLWKLVLSRNGVQKTIRATKEHRWFARSPGALTNAELTTDCLAPKYQLQSARKMPGSKTILPSSWGIAHGFAFGDGTRVKEGVRVHLWGRKDAALRPYFALCGKASAKTARGVAGVRIDRLPFSFKRLPDIEECASFLYGWLAGYFAADGCVDAHGAPTLASASRENLEFVRRVCIRLGIFTYEIKSQLRMGLGKRPTPLYSLAFSRRALTDRFFIIREHRQRWLANNDVVERPGWRVVSVEETDALEEVFCATVDKTHRFVIDGNIVTGNCFACKAGGSLVDLVMKLRGIEYKSAKDFIASAGKNYEPPKARVRVIERPPLLGRMMFKLPPECVMDEPTEKWPTLARRYIEFRRITEDEIRAYGLGYAADGRLGGRLVFPVRVGAAARVMSYSARSFVDADRKYLTPHESEDADLDALFGEHLWPVPDDRDLICVTEGAINALACARATGFPASSISGSDVRPGHVVKLATFRCVALLTDPDKAGDKAARGFASSLGRRANVVRVRLPAGKDAADMPQDELRLAIDRAVEHGSG